MKITDIFSIRDTSQISQVETTASKNIFSTSLYEDSLKKIQGSEDKTSKLSAAFTWIKESLRGVYLYLRSWVLWRKKITPEEMIEFVNAQLKQFASQGRSCKKILFVIRCGNATYHDRQAPASQVLSDTPASIEKFFRERNRELYGDLRVTMCSILPATLLKKERVDWLFVGDRNFTAQIFKGDRATATDVEITGTPKLSKETLQKALEERLEDISSKSKDVERMPLLRAR